MVHHAKPEPTKALKLFKPLCGLRSSEAELSSADAGKHCPKP